MNDKIANNNCDDCCFSNNNDTDWSRLQETFLPDYEKTKTNGI